jgi:hypothetical protein
MVGVLAMLRWLVYGPCTMVGVLAILRWLDYWPCYDGWCTGHVTMVGVLAMLRWLVYGPCNDGWCTGHITMVGLLVMLRWLMYWPCYDGWCTGQVTMVGVLALNGRSIEYKWTALPLQSSCYVRIMRQSYLHSPVRCNGVVFNLRSGQLIKCVNPILKNRDT